MSKHLDELFMRRVLLIAEGGRGFTSPNPVVGACVVKGNRVIASGFHERYGAPHAEVNALKKAGARAKGATLYVTLEPCSTWGKTPPCVHAIIESGIKRVVVAALDPNPKHNGRAIQFLRKSGIRVEIGVFRHEAEIQNEGFRKWITTKLPFVTLKMAQSLDGKIATRTGDSQWISGKEARVFTHELRAKHDAVAVGKNTMLRDNARLNVRHVKSHWQPWRFVLDAKGETPLTSHFLNESGVSVIACSGKNLKAVSKKFQKKRIVILAVSEKNGRLNIREFLKKIGEFGIASILIEGGGELAASFLEENLVDKIYWIVAPKIIGGRDAKTSVEGLGVSRANQAKELCCVSVWNVGADFVIEGYVH